MGYQCERAKMKIRMRRLSHLLPRLIPNRSRCALTYRPPVIKVEWPGAEIRQRFTCSTQLIRPRSNNKVPIIISRGTASRRQMIRFGLARVCFLLLAVAACVTSFQLCGPPVFFLGRQIEDSSESIFVRRLSAIHYALMMQMINSVGQGAVHCRNTSRKKTTKSRRSSDE
jgi:hypothetical protein